MAARAVRCAVGGMLLTCATLEQLYIHRRPATTFLELWRNWSRLHLCGISNMITSCSRPRALQSPSCCAPCSRCAHPRNWAQFLILYFPATSRSCIQAAKFRCFHTIPLFWVWDYSRFAYYRSCDYSQEAAAAGWPLMNVVKLENMCTVVDASNFLELFDSKDRIQDRQVMSAIPSHPLSCVFHGHSLHEERCFPSIRISATPRQRSRRAGQES